MNLTAQFAYPFPVAVISDLLGIPRDHAFRNRNLSDELASGDGRDGDPEEAREEFRAFMDSLRDPIDEKRQHPAEDMISRMVQAHDGDETLSEEEMLATILLMYGAGHVTTVNLIGNAIVALMSHPDELAKLRADPSLTKNAIEETLRYWGPVDTVGRRIMSRSGCPVTEQAEVAGCPVAPGELITLNLASANRDPARFANPDEFDIGRADANRHVSFGKGIHLCLGAPLARVEGQVALETLLRRYPDLRLAVPANDLTWSGGVLRGFREVPLLF